METVIVNQEGVIGTTTFERVLDWEVDEDLCLIIQVNRNRRVIYAPGQWVWFDAYTI